MSVVGAAGSEPAAIARVAVLPPITGSELLAYALPPSLAARVREGMRVLVPLGGRQVTGIVLEVGGEPPKVRLREVLDVLDEEPLLSRELLDLCRFASSYYMATLGDVLSTAVLAGLRAESHRTVRLVRAPAEDELTALGKTERDILRRLRPQHPVRVGALARAARASRFYDALRSLAAAGWITVDERGARPAASVRYETLWRLVRVASSEERALLENRAPAQWRALERVASAGQQGFRAGDVGEDVRLSSLRALAVRGLVQAERVEVYRQVAPASGGVRPPFTPNAEQQRAIDAISATVAERRFQTFLLHGVTGSGKTEVYLRRRRRRSPPGAARSSSCPRSRSRTQLVERVRARFGDARRRPAQRARPTASAATSGAASRAARRASSSARARPSSPRCRPRARRRRRGARRRLQAGGRHCATTRATWPWCAPSSRVPVVVLASATPSSRAITTRSAARYALLELAERVERRPLPPVELVDLRAAPAARQAAGALARVSPRRSAPTSRPRAQTLLFLNRRGFAHLPAVPRLRRDACAARTAA